MEEDQELIKHVCKFCRKSFPSGRSLGGHMRSHDYDRDHDDDYDDHDDDNDDDEFVVAVRTTMKKEEGCSEGYYGLRENPKKTWRVLTDASFDEEIQDPFDAVLDKLCKECGRGFQSLKALFGHMKCHSDKERVSNQKKNSSFELDEEEEEEEEDSNANVLPKRKRRSKRSLRTRYIKSNISSSVVNFCDNSLDSCSVSEEEEVAMSLVMLSRDVRPWCGVNFIAESYDNDNDDDRNSLELEVPLTHLVSKIEGKKFIINSSENVKMNKKPKKLDFSNIDSSNLKSKGESLEFFDNENGKDEKKEMKVELDSESAFEFNVSSKSGTSMKEKFFDSETKVTSEGECSKRKYQKRRKFECATCNKFFQSYQALGGHRASHKRTKGLSASRNEQGSENGNSGEMQLEVDVKKINGNAEGRMVESERVVLKEEVSEIRDFLDLNLPAASIDDERNGFSEIYKPWWLVGRNLKQETMIGLLSN